MLGRWNLTTAAVAAAVVAGGLCAPLAPSASATTTPPATVEAATIADATGDAEVAPGSPLKDPLDLTALDYRSTPSGDLAITFTATDIQGADRDGGREQFLAAIYFARSDYRYNVGHTGGGVLIVQNSRTGKVVRYAHRHLVVRPRLNQAVLTVPASAIGNPATVRVGAGVFVMDPKEHEVLSSDFRVRGPAVSLQ